MATAMTLKNLSYTLRLTGKTRKIDPEYGVPYFLPEVEIVETHSVNDLDSFDGVSELGGEFFYSHEQSYEYDGKETAVVLSKKRFGGDYGDNVWDERIAPQSTQGICSRGPGGRKPPQRSWYSPPLYVVAPRS